MLRFPFWFEFWFGVGTPCGRNCRDFRERELRRTAYPGFLVRLHAPALHSPRQSGAWVGRKMVAADGGGQQQQGVAETDPAGVETTAETFDGLNREGSSRGGSSRGGSSRGGGSRGGAVAGVRSGGGAGEGDTEGNLEDEAAVGSIHHILKTAFKELYGGGADEKEEEKGHACAAEAAGKRQGVSAGASGSESGRRSSSSTAGTANADGEAGHMTAV